MPAIANFQKNRERVGDFVHRPDLNLPYGYRYHQYNRHGSTKIDPEYLSPEGNIFGVKEYEMAYEKYLKDQLEKEEEEVSEYVNKEQQE